jgi:hypothetical protein
MWKSEKHSALERAGAFCVLLPGGGGAANKDTPRPPPRESEKNSGGVRTKKAGCFLALESTKNDRQVLLVFFCS